MNKSLLNDEEKKWKTIYDIDWYYLYRKYGNDTNTKVCDFFINNQYTIEEISELKNFIVEKRENIRNIIQTFFRYCPKYIKNQYKLNDDGLWDLCSNIVGMGKVMYDVVLKNPKIVIELQNIKQENFEYGFDMAIYKINGHEN